MRLLFKESHNGKQRCAARIEGQGMKLLMIQEIPKKEDYGSGATQLIGRTSIGNLTRTHLALRKPSTDYITVALQNHGKGEALCLNSQEGPTL